MKTPYAIIIMDGYGCNPLSIGNAICMDGSKNVTNLRKTYPSSKLGASGLSVGLPAGQMGNSEVGHLNIGAGRAVHSSLSRELNAQRSVSRYSRVLPLQRGRVDGRGLSGRASPRRVVPRKISFVSLSKNMSEYFG